MRLKKLLCATLALLMLLPTMTTALAFADGADEGEPEPIYEEAFDTLPAGFEEGWEIVATDNGYALKGTSAESSGLLGDFTDVGTLTKPFTLVADMMMEIVGSNSIAVGFTFAKTDDKNYYHYRMNSSDSAQVAQLYRWNKAYSGSGAKQVGSNYNMACEEYLPFRMRVTYDGSVLKCYTDGVLAQSTERELENGSIGLRIYNATAYIDDMRVYEGAIPPPEEGEWADSFLTRGESLILNNEDEGYVESSGSFEAVSGIGQNGSDARVATEGSASFSSYPPIDGTCTYELAYFLPASDCGKTEITVNTMNGMWKYTVPANSPSGWYQLGTVAATAFSSFSLTAKSEGKLYADAVRMTHVLYARADETYSPSLGGSDDVAILVNQIGYDCGSSKRATVPNVENGTPFTVINTVTGLVAFEGTVEDNIADFTALDTETDTDFYVECAGTISYVFTIGDDIIQRRSVLNALAFMSETRADTFKWGEAYVGWRDSHQFSFELNSLVWQYMANPGLYDAMDYQIPYADTCEYEVLRVQDEPAMVWLIQFAAMRYYEWGAIDGKDLHMLTKEQLAYFLYVYPLISEYVSFATYEAIRDYTISVWGVNKVSSDCQYYAVEGTNHDLYALQTVFGGLKGSQPPGHSIVPNLLMYEVAKRDGLGDETAQKFFDAAYNNAAYLIGDEFDINDPYYNKGQRMSEHVMITGLSYFLETYPDKAPAGLKDAITEWATTTVARSDNMWDLRMAVSYDAGDFQYSFHTRGTKILKEYWTGAAYALADGQSPAPKNEPGNQAGFQAIAYAAARVIDTGDVADRLKALGVAAIDDLYGRNPTGRAAFYHFTRDFVGADLGWYKQFKGGSGQLGGCTAVIDANAPEACYPYNPENYNTGYTEGWIAYNTAWNTSLAYAAADSIVLSVEKTAEGTIAILLSGAMNLDASKTETSYVLVTNLDTGITEKITVTENGTSSSSFTASYTLPEASAVKVSYGYGIFENSVTVDVNGADTPSGDTPSGDTPSGDTPTTTPITTEPTEEPDDQPMTALLIALGGIALAGAIAGVVIVIKKKR